MGLARRSYRAIIALTAAGTLLSAGLAWDIWRFAGYSAPGPAGAAMVLGAAVLGDEPSPVLVERLRHAEELYQAGDVRKIVVTGGLSPEDDLSEAVASRNWLEAEGIPERDIVVEDQSRTTFENFQLAKPIMEQAGISDVLIVSDPLHMRRAKLIADRTGIVAETSPTRTSLYRSWDTVIPFLAREVWFMGQYLLFGL
jgi:uncharacterized SAM-binding protein YcdF (DUF218 family)